MDAAIRRHYEVEVELADRLRGAPEEERRSGLYAAIYEERLRRIPSHPLVVRAKDPSARAAATEPQVRLLTPWLTPDTVFLEVGPGDCAVTLAVARRVAHVYAVDVTDGLRQENDVPANFHFVRSNGVDVPVPPGAIDVAYSNQVLEHLHPDDAVEHVRAVAAALAPGGTFVCVTPNRLSGPWDVSRHFDTVARGLHLKEYTTSEVGDLLRSAGLRVRLLASYRGRHVLPVIPQSPLRAFEALAERVPPRLRRTLAVPLVALKVVATKPVSASA